MFCSSDKKESWRELVYWSGSVELHNNIGIKEKVLNCQKYNFSIHRCSLYEMQKSAKSWLPTEFIKKDRDN